VSAYAIILAATIFFPLVLSFDTKVAFWKKWPRAFLSSLLVGIPFIAWDAWASARGDWSFSATRTWPARLFGLPLEELFFFLVAPMACVFIHACVTAYFRPRSFAFRSWPFLALAGILLLLIIPAWPRFYTVTLLGFGAAFLVCCAVWGRGVCADIRFWISLLICYIPFLVVNGFLTGIPVVSYSGSAILGPRILSIPIEDFLYSLALVGGTILTYEKLGSARRVRGTKVER
jgi:lycopene cyclase domain-containing protein